MREETRIGEYLFLLPANHNQRMRLKFSIEILHKIENYIIPYMYLNNKENELQQRMFT